MKWDPHIFPKTKVTSSNCWSCWTNPETISEWLLTENSSKYSAETLEPHFLYDLSNETVKTGFWWLIDWFSVYQQLVSALRGKRYLLLLCQVSVHMNISRESCGFQQLTPSFNSPPRRSSQMVSACSCTVLFHHDNVTFTKIKLHKNLWYEVIWRMEV